MAEGTRIQGSIGNSDPEEDSPNMMVYRKVGSFPGVFPHLGGVLGQQLGQAGREEKALGLLEEGFSDDGSLTGSSSDCFSVPEGILIACTIKQSIPFSQNKHIKHTSSKVNTFHYLPNCESFTGILRSVAVPGQKQQSEFLAGEQGNTFTPSVSLCPSLD